MNEISHAARRLPRVGLSTEFVWAHRWIPEAAAVTSWLVFLAALFWRKNELVIAISAAAALFCTFAWGYYVRAFRHGFSPALTHLKREQYATVWDSLAASKELACGAASGELEEAQVRSSAQGCLRDLIELARISSSDEVLEIGCGVGRIGRELATHCRSWTGCDVSAQMLRYAGERLKGVENVRLVQLRRGGLSEFKAASFDVVFAPNMLGHLDEIDRWRYVEEAFRVLRPGGRLSIDNIDLESDAGWQMFTNDAKNFADAERPPYMPTFSTAAEFIAYASRAGFPEAIAHRRSPLVIVVATKIQMRRAIEQVSKE